MKIAVVGVGAMGSIYAGLLADAGHEVWAIDVWRDHLDAITQTGLRIDSADSSRTVTGLNVAATVAEAGACDLYIIATKASAVGDAAKAVSGAMAPSSLVLTIQNGLGAGERIADNMGTENVLLGVAEGFGASVVGPGHVTHAAMKLIRIGEMAGGMTQRLENLADVWQQAGFQVRAFADIHQLIWEKFLCNVTLSGPCTVFDCTVGELMDHEDRWQVAMGCLQEAYDVGVAEKINFSFADPVEYVTAFATNVRPARPSMLQDHHAKRRSELDAINSQVPALGRKHGIATPHNNTVCAVVRAREAAFS